MIAIFGATGRVGGTAASVLREQGLATRAIVRAPERGERVAALGCELAVADLHDIATVRSAVHGAAAVLVICPLRPEAEDLLADTQHLVDYARPRARGGAPGARRRDLRLRRAAPHRDGPDHDLPWAFERRLRALTTALTIVRSAEHMQNWARQLPRVRAHGIVTSLHHPDVAPVPDGLGVRHRLGSPRSCSRLHCPRPAQPLDRSCGGPASTLRRRRGSSVRRHPRTTRQRAGPAARALDESAHRHGLQREPRAADRSAPGCAQRGPHRCGGGRGRTTTSPHRPLHGPGGVHRMTPAI